MFVFMLQYLIMIRPTVSSTTTSPEGTKPARKTPVKKTTTPQPDYTVAIIAVACLFCVTAIIIARMFGGVLRYCSHELFSCNTTQLLFTLVVTFVFVCHSQNLWIVGGVLRTRAQQFSRKYDG